MEGGARMKKNIDKDLVLSILVMILSAIAFLGNMLT